MLAVIFEKKWENMATHLGHDIKTHTEYYCLHSSTVELSKILRRNWLFLNIINLFFHQVFAYNKQVTNNYASVYAYTILLCIYEWLR